MRFNRSAAPTAATDPATRILVLTALCAGLALIPVHAQARESMADFMVMKICTDAADRPMAAVAPGDPACTRMRPIRAGEPVPYHLHDFPAVHAGCRGRLGSVSKDNIPVVQGGVTRIVAYYIKGADLACADTKATDTGFDEIDPSREGASVESVADGYGFIMGSWSPVALSSFRSPRCDQAPNSSEMMYNGWVIAPDPVPAKGSAAGYGVFPSHLDRGGPSSLFGACPAAYAKALTAWWRADVAYRGGMTEDSIVSSHYAQADAAGDAPGAAMQVERTFWAHDFGLLRWEKWARVDWINPRNHKAAEELARAVLRTGRCGEPAQVDLAISSHFALRTTVWNGLPAQTATDPATGESHVWVMTLCEDYSNIVRDNAPRVPDLAGVVDPGFWKLKDQSGALH